jgi:hypothetical protein
MVLSERQMRLKMKPQTLESKQNLEAIMFVEERNEVKRCGMNYEKYFTAYHTNFMIIGEEPIF